MANSTGKRCPSCTDEGILTCSGCCSVKYCSAECQQADWPTHKVLCKSFKVFHTRPTPTARRIIYFPLDGKKPEFRWAEIDNHDEWQGVEDKDMMDGKLARGMQFNVNPLTGVKLGYILEFNHDDDFLRNYSRPNKGVVAATAGWVGHDWRGPVYASCGLNRNGTLDIEEVTDMDMSTYADLVACLSHYCNETDAYKARLGPKVTAVKVTCDGEQRVYGVPAYQAVKVPRHHPVFNLQTPTSAISEQIYGMPLKIYRLNNRDPKLSKTGDICNPDVTFMMCNPDPNAEGELAKDIAPFGWAPMAWQDEVGTVLIASKTRQPLDTNEIEAFGGYCRHHLPQYFQWQAETELEVKDGSAKAVMLAEMTSSKWQEYLGQWKAYKKAETDEKSAQDLVHGMNLMGLNEEYGEKLSDRLFDGQRSFLEKARGKAERGA